jgi:trans-aconitate 2-methyltransferase
VALPEPVDAIFSSATFHWVLDHPALFANLFRLLKPGGVLMAQCGGAGNIARVRACAHAAIAAAPFVGQAAPPIERWRFAGAEDTAMLLEQAGFADVDTWLEPAPADFPARDDYVTYLRSVVLGPYLERLPEALHAPFVQATADQAARTGLGYRVDYVRLNLAGRRPE